MVKTGGKRTNLEDIALVELALQRDQGAFALLLEKYRSSLMAHILKYVSVVEDAEDICQRSFEKAFMNIDRYNAEFAFSTWLYNIAQNEAIDHLRRSRAAINSVPISEEREALDVLSTTTPEEELIIDQAVSELINGIQNLPESYRQVAELRAQIGEKKVLLAALHQGLRLRGHRPGARPSAGYRQDPDQPGPQAARTNRGKSLR